MGTFVTALINVFLIFITGGLWLIVLLIGCFFKGTFGNYDKNEYYKNWNKEYKKQKKYEKYNHRNNYYDE